MTKQIEFELVHNYKNCIDIDSSQEETQNQVIVSDDLQDAEESFETFASTDSIEETE